MNHKLTSASLIAAVAAVSLHGQAFAAGPQYQANPVVTASVATSYESSFGNAPGTTTSYTSFGLSSVSRATLPNGGFTSLIVGNLSGKTKDANAASVTTAFAYDPTNGFRLIGDYTSSATGARTSANIQNVNGVGQVIGTSYYSSTSSTDTNGTNLGQEAWLYSTSGNSNISIGLTGTNFSYTKPAIPVTPATTPPTTFAGTYRYSTPSFINNLGQVVGTTLRFAGDTNSSGVANTTPSTSLGTSAFLYSPGSGSNEIGLIDADHSYNLNVANANGTTPTRYSNNAVNGLTSSGTGPTATSYISGTATAYYDLGTGVAGTNLGTDGWVSVNGATPTAIGFYQRGIDPAVDNASGATFKYYVTKTANVGTTPSSSQSRATSITALNSTGQVIGTGTYYTAAGGFAGQDAFIYSSATQKYRQLGFYSNGFATNTTPTTPTTPAAGNTSYVSLTGGRTTNVNYLNDAGQSVGNSTQYYYYKNASNTTVLATSQVAWTDSGTGPTRIGLYGQPSDVNTSTNVSRHVDPVTGSTTSSVTNLTQSGYVGGYSNRYTLNGAASLGIGQDAWVYDPSGNINPIYPVDATSSDLGYYTNTLISYLSEDGIAVGQYRNSTTSTSSTGLYNKAFLWSLATGFVDLNTSLSPALTTTGYQNLITSFFSSTGGTTLYATGSKGLDANVGGLFVLTPAVPEPTTLAVVVGGAFTLIRRRRRTA